MKKYTYRSFTYLCCYWHPFFISTWRRHQLLYLLFFQETVWLCWTLISSVFIWVIFFLWDHVRWVLGQLFSWNVIFFHQVLLIFSIVLLLLQCYLICLCMWIMFCLCWWNRFSISRSDWLNLRLRWCLWGCWCFCGCRLGLYFCCLWYCCLLSLLIYSHFCFCLSYFFLFVWFFLFCWFL